MITLRDIRERVKTLTSHYPTAISYSTELDEIINSAHIQIWGSHMWDFRIKEQELRKYPDITSSTSTLTASHMSRLVTFSIAIGRLGVGFYEHDWEGQVIEIEGREYPILKIINSTNIVLAEPFRGDATTTSDWKIKHRWDVLPHDCDRLVGYAAMDKPFPGNVSHGTTNGTIISTTYCPHYKQDETNDYANTVFRAPDLTLPPAGKLSAADTSTADTFAFPQNKWYEFAWSFRYANQYGSLSEPVKIQTDAGTLNRITLTLTDQSDQAVQRPGYDFEEVPYPHRYEGLEKIIWWNANTNPSAASESEVRLGKPVWYPVIGYVDSTGQQDDYQQKAISDSTNTITLTALAQLTTSPNTNFSIGGARPQTTRWLPHNIQRIQCWPRVDRTDQSIAAATLPTQPLEAFSADIIQYLYIPNELLLSEDAIAFPASFVDCISYKAASLLSQKLRDQSNSQLFEARYQQELERLLREHTTSKDKHLTNGKWSYSREGIRSWPFGIGSRFVFNG